VHSDGTSLLEFVQNSFDIQGTHMHHRVYLCMAASSAHTVEQGPTTVVNATEHSAASGKLAVSCVRAWAGPHGDASPLLPTPYPPHLAHLAFAGPLHPGTIAPPTPLAHPWGPPPAPGLAQVTHVVSQLDVVRLLQANQGALGGAAQQTLADMGLDEGAVFCVPATTPALEAFARMATDHKSCLGLTDPASGKLVSREQQQCSMLRPGTALPCQHPYIGMPLQVAAPLGPSTAGGQPVRLGRALPA
jgi:hypothetical protein